MSPRDRDQQKRDGEKRDLGQQVEGRRAVRELLVAGTAAGQRDLAVRRRRGDRGAGRRHPHPGAAGSGRSAGTAGTHQRAAGRGGVRRADRPRRRRRDARRSRGLPRRARRRHRSAEPRRGDAHGRDRRCHRHACSRATVRSGLTPAVAKAAAGALEYLPVAFVSGIPGVLERAARARTCGASGSTPTATRRSSSCRLPTNRSCSCSVPRVAACRGSRVRAARWSRRSPCTGTSSRST